VALDAGLFPEKPPEHDMKASNVFGRRDLACPVTADTITWVWLADHACLISATQPFRLDRAGWFA
jgi:hypothetical protein